MWTCINKIIMQQINTPKYDYPRPIYDFFHDYHFEAYTALIKR